MPDYTDKAKLERLLSLLNDHADTVDGPEGEPRANQAASILTDYQGWLDGWVK